MDTRHIVSRALLLILSLSACTHVTFGSRRGLWEVDHELGDTIGWLKDNGFSTLVDLLQKHGIDQALLDLLQHGTKITLLAPDDDAFSSTPNCGLDVKDVLLDHVIPQKLTARMIKKAPVGTQVKSLGKHPVSKSDNKPLKVKIVGKDGHDDHPRRKLADEAASNSSADGDSETQHESWHHKDSTTQSEGEKDPLPSGDSSGGAHKEEKKGVAEKHQKHGGKHHHKDPKGRELTAEAEVTEPNAYVKKSIVVHRLDKVLALCPTYP